jgi:predicted XRE-type DNA-binding protein
MAMSSNEKVHRGSGNVFADIGVAHPDRVLVRAQVMSRIAEIINERGITQKKAAKVKKLLAMLKQRASLKNLKRKAL